MDTIGTLFDRNFSDEEDSNGNGNRSACTIEMVSRLSALHASKQPRLVLCGTGCSDVFHRALLTPCGIRPAALHVYFTIALLRGHAARGRECGRGGYEQGRGTFRPDPRFLKLRNRLPHSSAPHAPKSVPGKSPR